MSDSQSSSPRIAELDALRGLAAIAVLIYHFTSYYHQKYGHSSEMPWRFLWGTYGVNLFFIISGFVIMGTLERCTGWTSFVRARFFRLYPAFWAALIVSYICLNELPDRVASVQDLLWNATMLPSFFGQPYVNGTYWTLEVELFFYAFMLALFSLRFLHRERMSVVLMIWLGLSMIWRMFVTEPSAVSEFVAKALILTEISLFASGIILYQIYRDASVRKMDVLLIILVAASQYVWGSRGGLFFTAFNLSLTAVAVFLRPAWLRWRLLLDLGALSYVLYLLHQNLGLAIIHASYRWQISPWFGLGLAFVAVFVLARGLHRWIEKPAMKMRHGSRQEPPWEIFQDDKVKMIFERGGRIVDIGGGLRISPGKSNRFDERRYLRYKHHLQSPNVRFLVSDYTDKYKPDIIEDIHALSFENNSIDGIFCLAVLEHVPQPHKAAHEILRVLKPGGALYGYVPFLYPYHAHATDYADFFRYSSDGIRALFAGASHIEMAPVYGYSETILNLSILNRFPAILRLARYLDQHIGAFRRRSFHYASGYNFFVVK